MQAVQVVQDLQDLMTARLQDKIPYSHPSQILYHIIHAASQEII